jgi:hypothetical protein
LGNVITWTLQQNDKIKRFPLNQLFSETVRFVNTDTFIFFRTDVTPHRVTAHQISFATNPAAIQVMAETSGTQHCRFEEADIRHRNLPPKQSSNFLMNSTFTLLPVNPIDVAVQNRGNIKSANNLIGNQLDSDFIGRERTRKLFQTEDSFFQKNEFSQPNGIREHQLLHSSRSKITNNDPPNNAVLHWAPNPTFPKEMNNGSSSFPANCHLQNWYPSLLEQQKPISSKSEGTKIKSLHQSKKPRFLMPSDLETTHNALPSEPLNLQANHLTSHYKGSLEERNIPLVPSTSESSDSSGMSEYFSCRNEPTLLTETNCQNHLAAKVSQVFSIQIITERRQDNRQLFEETSPNGRNVYRDKITEEFDSIGRNPESIYGIDYRMVRPTEGEISNIREKVSELVDHHFKITNPNLESGSTRSTCNSQMMLVKASEEEITKLSGKICKLSSVQYQLNNVLDGFSFVTGKIDSHSESATQIVGFHQRKRPLNKSTIMSHLKIFKSTIAKFAFSQPTFASLTKQDQNVLLENNVPLYIQYILARYFSAESGLEQISWMMEGQISLQSIEEVQNLHFIGLREFNEKTQVIETEPLEKLYKCYSNNIGTFYAFPQQCNGLIANLLIYR